MGYITLKEAAQRLGISTTTARRMVKDGRLRAELREGPFGLTYYVDEAEIRTAQEVTDVVPVTRQISLPDLMRALGERDRDLREALGAIAEQQAELARAVKELVCTLAEERIAQAERDRILEDRNRKLTEALRSITQARERRSWWRRLFEG
ncbi:MAG: helix-turn-helix domain-containing protein [Methanoculleus sp.]